MCSIAEIQLFDLISYRILLYLDILFSLPFLSTELLSHLCYAVSLMSPFIHSSLPYNYPRLSGNPLHWFPSPILYIDSIFVKLEGGVGVEGERVEVKEGNMALRDG